MRLVFIYGPPAAGKLTVSKHLAKLTGYKVFHNQIIVDALLPYFKFRSKTFIDLSSKMRLDVFEAAAKENIDLIFTFCYAKKHDEKFVRQAIKSIKKYKGQTCFIQLYCDESQLYKRVNHESRKKFKKVRKIKTLKTTLKEFELLKPINFVKSLSIDNTKVSAKNVAEMITAHYKLPKV